MPVQYPSNVEAILSRRYDNGADHWTTPDRRLSKGGSFSTLQSTLLLLELGKEASDPLLDLGCVVISSLSWLLARLWWSGSIRSWLGLPSVRKGSQATLALSVTIRY